MIGEVGSATSTLVQTKAEASKLKKGFDKLVKASVPLAKRITPIAVKAATLGAIDVDKEYEKLLADLTGSIASDQLKKYSEAKSSITGFKEKLTLLAKDMSDKENPKPLIFIIDELDRCRPNFSIEVLEKAKHFFNVENIVFVLGIDKEQLGSSFRAVYGQGLNVDGYLRRFIDIEYMLPTPGRTLFPKALFEKFSFREFFL